MGLAVAWDTDKMVSMKSSQLASQPDLLWLFLSLFLHPIHPAASLIWLSNGEGTGNPTHMSSNDIKWPINQQGPQDSDLGLYT